MDVFGIWCTRIDPRPISLEFAHIYRDDWLRHWKGDGYDEEEGAVMGFTTREQAQIEADSHRENDAWMYEVRVLPPELAEEFEDDGAPVAEEKPPLTESTVTLRDYQKKALEDVRKLMGGKFRVYSLPLGFGKSIFAFSAWYQKDTTS